MSQLSVLLVDDDPHIHKIIQHYLADFKFELSIAENGYEALEKLMGIQYDLIILDFSMPFFNGLQVLKKLSGSSLNKNTAIMVMSATDDKDDIVRFFEFGITDYIIKPPSKEDFLKRVSRALLKDLRVS